LLLPGTLPGKENATKDKKDDEKNDAGRSGIGFERRVKNSV
jgi:hypothetical protein